MTEMNRRTVLSATMAAGLAGIVASPAASAAGGVSAQGAPRPPRAPAKVRPDDTRYPDLLARGANQRFRSEPDYVHLARSTEEVVTAVSEAVGAGKRVVVRSGGHCFADFVDNPETEVIVDLSAMEEVGFDSQRGAFVVGPGVLLGDLYRRLFLGWGVTVPLGSCPEVGAGGHILGGGHGAMSRLHGLGVDHLYAVEVVTVDDRGRVAVTVATREPDDPHHDLWWAHTGGGGGNFGVVTRYWLRTPGVRGTDPTRLLPRPPAEVLTFSLQWAWEDLDHDAFVRLVTQHGDWHQAHSEPGTPEASLHSALLLFGTELGVVLLHGQVAGEDAEELLGTYLEAVTDGVVEPFVREEHRTPWLQNQVSAGNSEDVLGARFRVKTGYRRERFSDQQVEVLWEYLSAPPGSGPQGSVWLVSGGGAVNDPGPDDTAVAQRDAVLKAIFVVSAPDEDGDEAYATWVRELYRDVYSDTAGVPAHDAANSGCFINYPDPDLASPEHNTSGVPWHRLYYGQNYPRLQRVKARWDPANHFRHSLSVEAR